MVRNKCVETMQVIKLTLSEKGTDYTSLRFVEQAV